MSRPEQWTHGGYAEVRTLRARYGVIDVGALCDLSGFGGVAELQTAQRGRVDESLKLEGRARTPEWATAIAVGSPDFVAKVKADIGIAARHRDLVVSGTTGVLCEPEAADHHEMHRETGRLSAPNSYLWNEPRGSSGGCVGPTPKWPVGPTPKWPIVT